MVFRDDIAVLAPQQTVKLSGPHFEPGDTIICEGEVGESAYVILAGTAEVTREQDRETIHLTTLSEGECFGEIALLTDTKRTKMRRHLVDRRFPSRQAYYESGCENHLAQVQRM